MQVHISMATLHVHIIIDEMCKIHHANKCSDIHTLTVYEERAFKTFNGNVLVKKYVP